MRQRLYTCAAVEDLINRYVEKGGEIAEIEPGTLGYGFMILYGPGLKTAVVNEVALNEWQSAHKIRMYNVTPAKYQKIIDDYEAGLYDAETA